MNAQGTDGNSTSRMGTATLLAILVAFGLLLVVIWPAEDKERGAEAEQTTVADPAADNEYQQPPTDDGAIDDELAAIMSGNIRLAETGTQVSSDTPFKTEEFRIQLASLEEVEYKAHMKPGETLVYSWQSSQPMYVDMHGEPYTYPDEPAVRYLERDGVQSGHGKVTATFPGMNGWFWMNTGEQAAEIVLNVSGFYDRFEEVHRSAPQ